MSTLPVNPLQDPHGNGPVGDFGAALNHAAGAVILLHGRGGSVTDILSLARVLYDPRLIYLAPQASRNSWYPQSFLAPRAENEPWLTSALRKVESVVESVLAAGIPRERIILGGFSQGACLSTEFVATHPARYGGLIAFTGGLIGPLGSDLSHSGDLAGTPVFMGSGDPDPHVPWSRVEESAAILRGMGAVVTTRRYPGKQHSVSAEEIDFAARLVHDAVAGFSLDAVAGLPLEKDPRHLS